MNRNSIFAHLLLLVLPLAAVVLNGCAVFNEDNRRFLNTLDGAVQPESTAVRTVLAPVALPVGTAALVTDMVLVHPVCVIPDAADDVYEIFWKPRDIDILRKSLLLPISVVLTPPTFLGDWLVRSIFNVNSSAERVGG